MEVLDDMPPIYHTDAHVLRARRTAAWTRAGLGLMGIALIILDSELLDHPIAGATGFLVIAVTAIVQLLAPRLSWMRTEESLSGIAGLLIIGVQTERVSVIGIIWLAAVASGVLARGGRVHWIGRTVVLCALVLPILRSGSLTLDYAALCGTTIGLLLTSGRLTRELNRLLHQARYDADHDDLTGLLSYAAFRAVLERTANGSSQSTPMSLLLLDLERFGIVNKAHGHAAGDRLLALVGESLRTVAGPACTVGRLGGDEFAVIAAGDDPLPLAQALLDALPKRCEEDPRPICACVGISQTPRDGDSGEALLRAADIALRVAKRGGAGQISSYEGGSLSGSGERSARHALDRMIEGKGLSMAVQPIVDLRDGSVHAYEALARFGRRSTDSPLHWLAIAEEFGERDLLEHACLRAALRLFATRPAGMRLSVNLSAPVLLDQRTLSILERPADLAGLIIEVTEEALVQSETQLHQTIDPLLERGAMLAVDDMGAGYSGLRQITTVHPSYLKLDRSLITAIDEDDDRQALVGALLGYAERVGSLLVAEG
ncbi:MAG TPA: EAL domain-containing protein, partial [Solirubrobacteraceae bacterium]|nr:EAL domain-containing protein [Solirubrobacteraceae bacterium]